MSGSSVAVGFLLKGTRDPQYWLKCSSLACARPHL